MKVFFVRNVKPKLIVFTLVCIMWLLVFLIVRHLAGSSVIYTVCIDNVVSFSHPANLKIEDIYVRDFHSGIVFADSPLKTDSSVKFSSYSSLLGKFSFDYPSAFTIDEKDFSGCDILYHIDFHDKTGNTHGFVQVWNLHEPLESFLENSKKLSGQNFTKFDSSPVSINETDGFFWDYSVVTSSGVAFKGNEVFLAKNGIMYRISFFVPEKSWNDKYSDTFWDIVKSFKIL